MLDSDELGPINLGNPRENTISELAEMVLEALPTHSRIEYHPLPQDDPTRRKPDIRRANTLLGWAPEVTIEDGLRRTIDWFQAHSREVAAARFALAGPQMPSQPDVIDLDLVREAV
jgi:dTDP-glucose 4,6-dehydratase